jgi:transposase
MTISSAKFRIYPTKSQVGKLLSWENAMRFLWNCALEHRLSAYNAYLFNRAYFTTNKSHYFPNYNSQAKDLTEIRNIKYKNSDDKDVYTYQFLRDLPRNIANNLLINLDKTWNDWLIKKTKGKPKFKKKNNNKISFTESDFHGFNIKGNVLTFPKLGKVRIVKHKSIPDVLKTCTISKEVDQWFVSITYEDDIAIPTPNLPPRIIAIDRGITNITADSQGKIISNQRFDNKLVDKITKLQKNISKKVKGSKNRQKEKDKLSKVYRKIKRKKEHFLHEISNYYVNNHDIIILEKLDIKNMVSNEKHEEKIRLGKNRFRGDKTKLNRSIHESCMGRLGEFISYKSKKFQKTLVFENPAYSSQECSKCHHIDSNNRVGEKFHCIKCWHAAHADVNAAQVLEYRFSSRRNDGGKVCGAAPIGAATKQKRSFVRKNLVNKIKLISESPSL